MISRALKISFSFIVISTSLFAQKRPVAHDDFDQWNRIRSEKISSDGKVVVYHLTPGKGDVTMNIVTTDGNQVTSLPRSEGSRISWDSRYVIFRIKPAMDSLNALRRKKVKEKKLPKDTLGIYDLSNNSLQKIARVKGFKVPEKWSGYIAYQLDEKLVQKDTTKKKEEPDKSEKPKKKKKKEKKVGKENGYHLVVRNLSTQAQDTFKYVLEYVFAEEGKAMLFATTGTDSTVMPGVYHYDLDQKSLTPLTRSKGKYNQLALSKDGKQAGFLADLDTTKALVRNVGLRYWRAGMDSAQVKADNSTSSLPEGWVVNSHGNLSFSDNGERLLFGASPQPVVKDTTLLPEEIIKVEIWNYQNGRLHTQQNAELDEDQKKTYLVTMDTDDFEIRQLGSTEIHSVRTADKGNADHALGISNLAYQKYISWEGSPRHNDFYHINMNTGERRLIVRDVRGTGSISAEGKYSYWYNAMDSAWYTYNHTTAKTHAVTSAIPTSMANERNDTPNLPSSYGLAGWTEGDEHILIYDRYDIWQVDPDNSSAPVNLTNGRSKKMRYRYLDLDREEEAISYKTLLLSAFSEATRDAGYFELKPGRSLKELIYDGHRYSRPLKAENSDQLLFTKQNHQVFPDLLSVDLSFKKIISLSDANPHKKDFLWGNVELYKWTSLDGIELEGLLYKPENFDPGKKYPMITYFYERNSDNLHRHWGAVPVRSIVNPAFYASNGYIIFIPDIVYRTGYPGESCYNAVIPGVTQLISEGFVDEDRIGVQGHSWGGYQAAYLVTKTNIFAAAEAGAPVANMISAYGGIRWWTGLSRMFQYEHTQSRIGGTLWEYPLRYIENSPIFFVDKIQTPLLLMHNDEDGHVPWYQGIEFYVALRRLGKPAWMLNYNGEPHWPTKWENIRDFNIRMHQFFDHYLKDQPKPKWMAEGIPAIQKGIDKGYELMKE